MDKLSSNKTIAPSAGKTAANISDAENQPIDEEKVKAAKRTMTKSKYCKTNNSGNNSFIYKEKFLNSN